MSQNVKRPSRRSGTANGKRTQSRRSAEPEQSISRERTAVRTAERPKSDWPGSSDWETAAERSSSRRQPAAEPKQRPAEPEERHTERRSSSGRRRSEIEAGRPGWYRAASQKTRRFRRRWRRILREERADRFPESERIPIQMMLFFLGMFPMWGSLLQERLMRQHSKSVQKSGRFLSWLEGHRVHSVLFLASGCAAAAVLLFFSIYTMGTTVTYNGKVIASLSSEAAAEDARADLERMTAQTLGHTFKIDESLLHYESGWLRRQDLVDKETYEEGLSQEIGLVTDAYCLYVNGERIGATPYKGALEQLLEQIQLSATNEGTISCSFAEDVTIQQEFVPTDEIMNLGHLAETLYSTKTAEVTYTVAKGDTWSEIAENHGLTSKELLALNPGYNIDKLQIGEILTMSASVPYLTMTVVQQERYLDPVFYEIEYTDTAELYKGDDKVTSPGQYGAADVVANVTYVNGSEVERTVLSRVTLQEPVTEQRLRGTKDRPTWHPTGTFRWPVSGHITSYYGTRRSGYHGGLDIACPYGTPVYAADGGTVTYAGWMGTYGYLVRIDHGNGYETYYAHNSSIVTSVGAHVYKGQQIARVGSTGNSTGNHCHFEVRYNGARRNPLNYL